MISVYKSCVVIFLSERQHRSSPWRETQSARVNAPLILAVILIRADAAAAAAQQLGNKTEKKNVLLYVFVLS